MAEGRERIFRGVGMMTIIINPRELPDHKLRMFVASEIDARKMSTQYAVAWFYQWHNSKVGCLYLLNSEWQKKQEEKT